MIDGAWLPFRADAISARGYQMTTAQTSASGTAAPPMTTHLRMSAGSLEYLKIWTATKRQTAAPRMMRNKSDGVS
ncbi:hypothetical protein XH92_27995 [Bradyrhizobium sp. CCBAU 53421]|nr:hypothetical protein XH92_27995 [Bradyrhizobium sp. CCBAU 53421]